MQMKTQCYTSLPRNRERKDGYARCWSTNSLVAAAVAVGVVSVEVTASLGDRGRLGVNVLRLGNGLPDGVDLLAAAGCLRLGLLNGLLGEGLGGRLDGCFGGLGLDGVLDDVGGGLLEDGKAVASSGLAGRRGGRVLRATGKEIVDVGDEILEAVQTEAPAQDGVVTREGRHVAGGLLIDTRLNGAVLVVELESGALVHAVTFRGGVAGVDDVAESVVVPGSHEISVRRETSGITVGKNERLLALALSPASLERRSVPVDLEEEVGVVRVTLGAVKLALAVVLGPGHVVLVVIEALLGIVAGRHVNVGTERRGEAIASHVRETNTLALVDGVANAGSGTVGVGRPGWRAVAIVGTGASELDVLNGALGGVQVGLRGLGSSAGVRVTAEDFKTNGERLEVVVGGLEASPCQRHVRVFTSGPTKTYK